MGLHFRVHMMTDQDLDGSSCIFLLFVIPILDPSSSLYQQFSLSDLTHVKLK